MQVSQAWIINYIPHLLWDVINYPCLRYLLLGLQSSYGNQLSQIFINSMWPSLSDCICLTMNYTSRVLWPCDTIELYQHWLKQWLAARWHQTTTWTNVVLFSKENIRTNLTEIWVKIERKCFWKCFLQNVGTIIQASICQNQIDALYLINYI